MRKNDRDLKGNDCRTTIIFDFDGTLADTLPVNHQLLNELSRKYKFKYLSERELPKLQELSAKEAINYLGIPWYKLPFILAEGKSRLQSKISEVRATAEFCQILQEAKANCNIGIVTTNSRKNVDLFIQKNSFPTFDFVCSDTRMFGKSKALKKTIKKHRLSPERTLYVGDEVRDIQAAQKTGIAIASVCWGYNSKQALEKHKPTYLVQTLEELNQVIRDFLNRPLESNFAE